MLDASGDMSPVVSSLQFSTVIVGVACVPNTVQPHVKLMSEIMACSQMESDRFLVHHGMSFYYLDL